MTFNPDNPNEHEEFTLTVPDTDPAEVFGGGSSTQVETPPGEIGEEIQALPRTIDVTFEKISRMSEAEFRGLMRRLRDEQKIAAEAFLWMGATWNVRIDRLEKALGRIEDLLRTYRPVHPSEMLELIRAHFLLQTGEELESWLGTRGQPPLDEKTLEHYAPTGSHTTASMDKLAANNDAAAGRGGVPNLESPNCPLCGAIMEPRKGKYGRFWGCSMFRESGCKGSIDIDPKPWSTGGSAQASLDPFSEQSTSSLPKEPDPNGGELIEF